MLEHDDLLDAGGAFRQRFVRGGLELHDLAAAIATVGGDDEAGLGILDAVAHRECGEATEHHGMDGADAGAGLHGDDGLGHQRHVDDDAIATLHTEHPQCVAELADLGMQLAVGQAADVAVLGFEHQRGMVAAGGEVHIDAVDRGIELAIGEPAVVGGVAVVERAGEGLVPHQRFAGLCGPEPFGIMRGLLVQAMQLVAAGAGAMREVMRGREAAGLGQRGFDRFLVHGGIISSVARPGDPAGRRSRWRYRRSRWRRGRAAGGAAARGLRAAACHSGCG